jgi:predicted methyltransferase
MAFSSAVAQPDITAILADASRPAADRDRDAGRKPDQVLAFLDIGPGDKVADLLCGGGYYTRILVPAVGENGEVYAGNNPFFQRFGDEALTALLTEPGFENVHRIDGPVDELALPANGSLDAVIIVLAYHDLWLTDEDRNELNRRVFAALKPGGVYGIIDHHAAEGTGTDVIQSLHRIEESIISTEISAVGFSLVARADFLANPDDDHSLRVFDPSIRGNTDRFVLRFEKP